MDALLIQALTPDRLEDYLAFFDGDAFADNPDWSACYCYFYHAPGSMKDWEARTAAENRAAVADLIQAGKLHGYLAYVDGRPVGWCHAAPRPEFPNLRRDRQLDTPDAAAVGSIVCFIVARPYRRRGIARGLLQAACAGFRDAGLTYAEAYPQLNTTDASANYHGPLSLYLAEGFSIVKSFEHFCLVRKTL